MYSTVLGGTASDGASAVAVDSAGNAWLTGATGSSDFPVIADAADATANGATDAFIAELSASGSALLYSTYLGGSQTEVGNDIARDSAGNVYVTGHTYSMDFPATTGAFDTVFAGDLSNSWGDAFVTKLALARATSTPPAPPPVPAAPALLAPANADTPPRPITFSWSVVAGAASYEIQIDDSSGFAAPLVRDQTVSTTMYATTGLATATNFWRVRGINLAGAAGAWSATRSFTPQAPPPPATLSTMSTTRRRSSAATSPRAPSSSACLHLTAAPSWRSRAAILWWPRCPRASPSRPCASPAPSRSRPLRSRPARPS